MKTLICLARTPDTTAKIVFNDAKTAYDGSQTQWIINPYDEWYALGRAIELKEEGKLSQIDLLTVGDLEVEATMRKALALGGDNAYRINQKVNDSISTASLIATFIKGKEYDLILGGKETIDYNGASVMAMVASYLDKPFVSQITSLDVTDNRFIFKRHITEGVQGGSVDSTVVLACQKGLAEPRLPSMRGVISARKKPILVQQYDHQEAETVETVEMCTLNNKKTIEWIDENNVKQLFDVLKTKYHIHTK